MPILIDGNNLLHQLPRGQRDRGHVRRLALDICRGQRTRLVVVFDGPPPAGSPEREELGQVRILYSGTRSADDLIVNTIPRGSSAADWLVVTNDRQLRLRARDRGARVRTLAEWQKKRPAPRPAKPRTEPKLSSREVEEWESFFAERPEDD